MNNNKPEITFLFSFGHSGIDWLHSLLDSHPQILIMPAFSFYRSWKLLNADLAKTPDEMFKIWVHHFNSSKMQGKETKQFYTNKEIERFCSMFLERLNINGISRKATLWSIIRSYAWAKNIDLDKIKTIVQHEHVSFPYKNIFEDFMDPNILMILRDPRASIAGYYKSIEKKYGNFPDVYEHFINMSLEEWMNSCDLYKMYEYQLGNKFKIVINEKLSQNTKQVMLEVSKWLGIEYNDSLIKSTYPSGLAWVPDSSYISREEYSDINNFPEPIDKYFDTERVKKRWLSILNDKRDIIMIEFLFNDIMEKFLYERITKNTIFTKLKGLIYFLMPHRGKNRYKYYSVDQNEIIRVKKRLIATNKKIRAFVLSLFPLTVQSLIINITSVLNHLIIFYYPSDRLRRYDNPKTNLLFRNAA